MKFCKEKINWSIEQWKNVIFSDETMVVVVNDQNCIYGKKSDEKYAPHLVCHESKKRITVIVLGLRNIQWCWGSSSSFRHCR